MLNTKVLIIITLTISQIIKLTSEPRMLSGRKFKIKAT